MGFPGGASGKELPVNAEDKRDESLIPRWGRSPGGSHGNPLQYSCLGKSMDRGTGGLQSVGSKKSWTWLSD